MVYSMLLFLKVLENKDKVSEEKELIAMYRQYGEDPYILNDDSEDKFSAWTYASEKCKELFEK